MKLPRRTQLDTAAWWPAATCLAWMWGVAGFCPGPAWWRSGWARGKVFGSQLAGMLVFQVGFTVTRLAGIVTTASWVAAAVTVSIFCWSPMVVHTGPGCNATTHHAWLAPRQSGAGSGATQSARGQRNSGGTDPAQLMSADWRPPRRWVLIGARDADHADPLMPAYGEPLSTLRLPRMALELILVVILFASLVCSAAAVRCYNHASSSAPCRSNSAKGNVRGPTGVAYEDRVAVQLGFGCLLMVAYSG
jgi:hypothetical protein